MKKKLFLYSSLNARWEQASEHVKWCKMQIANCFIPFILPTIFYSFYFALCSFCVKCDFLVELNFYFSVSGEEEALQWWWWWHKRKVCNDVQVCD